MKAHNRFILVAVLLLWVGRCFAAMPPPGDTLKLVTQHGYLPQRGVLVRVEVLTATGQRDRDLWDAEATLSADQPGVTLSTNKVALRNGLGSALVIFSGGGDFTLTATVGSLSTNRLLKSLVGVPVTTVSGTLPGASTTWSNVINITASVTVPVGHTLTILSNTLVLVNGVASGTGGPVINVNGTIHSLGTEDEPVTITCADSAMRWGQIRHNNAQPSTYRYTVITRGGYASGEGHTGQAPVIRPSNSTILFESCSLTDYADASGTPGKVAYAIGSDLTFRDCLLARARMGPEIEGTALLFTNSWIMEMRGPNDSDGIYLHGQQAGQSIKLSGCVIYGGDDDAIDTLGSIITVTNCILRDWINPNEDAKGISGFDGLIDVQHCLIVNCFVGVSMKTDAGTAGRVNINQSTITGITRGIAAAVKDNAPGPIIDFRVTNSIVRSVDAVYTDFGPTNFTMGYCHFSESWPGTGNLSGDPLFVDEANGNYHLQPGSPCINTGDPAAPLDPDNSRADMGFYASVNGGGGPVTNTLIAFGSAWKYLDDGSNQGTNWIGRTFDDSSWSNGLAQLGYGDGDEVTTVRGNRADTTRIITTYFRYAFTLSGASTYTNLALRLLRDDGGVVYLNGVEIFRSPSMPSGPIAFDTLALSPTPPDNTVDTATVNGALPLLLNGANVIAVEIHQQALTSTDISFDFEIVGVAGSGASGGNLPPSVVLTSPANNDTFTEPANITIAATASDSDSSVSKVEFFQNGVKLGEAASAPYDFAWNAVPAGIYTLTAVATDDKGALGASAPIQVTVNSANAPTTNVLIATGSAWKYLDDGTDQGTGWINLAFDDSSWSNGVAQLGYGDGDEATVIHYGPDPSNKYVTSYFRRKFVVTDPVRVLGLTLNLLRDDGAIAYLNGTEVFRLSMPPGPVTYLTFATTASEYTFESTSVPTSVLVAGTNIMAVEVHQGNGTSSDVSFDLELAALMSAETNSRPIISLTAPAKGLTLAAPANITLNASASDSDGTVTNVAFYANGAKLADDALAPYSFAWNNVSSGNYSLTAVATDNVGLSSTSSVVSVTISTNTAPPVVSGKSPVPGPVTSLTQITVTFSKSVAGVNASDLLVNGAAATALSGSGSNYAFTFPQPAYGLVAITWAAGHGIGDVFTPSHPFDGNGSGATWQYTLVDVVPPVATTINPVPGSTVAALTNVAVTFSEPVVGVNASDLLINASPALAFSGSGAGPYMFRFGQPVQGVVQLAWAAGHAITDTAGNPFAGGGWSYDLNTNASGIVISEIMYHPSSERVSEEYIELFNKGALPVDLTNWRFSSGVQFIFPNVSIPAGGYLVVAADRSAFANKYPGVSNVVGNWTGFLNNSSEDINLDDAAGQRADSVQYADEGEWAMRQRGPLDLNHRGWKWLAEHDGLGKSLELINPDLSNNSGQNWAASRVTNGTPGRANSVLSNNIAPMILQAAHFPSVPRSTEGVLVTARLVDESPSGLSATLFYRADSATPPPFSSTAMHDDGLNGDAVAGDGLYSAMLPAQPNNTVVEFYVMASDAQARVRTWPAAVIAAPDGIGPTGQVANALYQVDDSTYNPTNNQPLYKLIMTENERAELAGIPPSGDRNTDAEMNGTFISLDGAGTELHYLVGFRNRGHGSRGANPPNYRAGFRSDDPWKGVTALNLNAVEVHVQHLGSVLARKAGVAGANTIPVQVRVNNANLAVSGSPMFGSYAANEVQGGDFAAKHFPLDPNGNVYRAIRDIAPPDFNYRGENANQYRNTYFKQSNLSEDDWTDLIGMLRVVGINNTTSFTTENVRQVVNVEQWMRHLALMNLFGNNETGLNTGFNDDYFMYSGVNDRRFLLTYYDLDTILGEGGSLPPDAGLFTATQNNGSGLAFDRFLHWPDFEPLYYRALREILDTTFAKANFDALVDQTLGSYVAAGTISSIKNWMDARRASVSAQLPVIVVTNPPRAVISGTPRSPTPLTAATLTVGGAGVTSYRFQLNGGGYQTEMLVTTPILLTSLANGTNTIAVIAKDNNGVWQATSNATVRSWMVNTAWPAVRLNEVLARNDMAVNHNGTFPDMIELFNEGSGPVDLSGLRLSDDPNSPNKFTVPNGTTLAMGAYLVLYANNADGTPGFHLGFTLDQDGEGVYLFDRAANGNVVLDSVAFGAQLPDLSIGRVAGGDWALTQPTFDSANVTRALGDAGTLRLNEWLAAAQSPFPDDFIELYNPDAQPVALGGLHLTDEPIGVPALHTIAPLSFMGGHGFLAFIADGHGDRANHVNFKLALEQGEIGLTAEDGSIIDCVIYGPQQPGVSSGRCPDGALTQRALNFPTPGAPNVCPATPAPPVSVTLLTMTNTWRYDSSGGDLGTAWRTTNYNDSAWALGRGVFGYDNNNNPLVQSLTNTVLPLTTTGGATIVTFYFRTHLSLASNIAATSLVFTNLMDDGAVVYLNGQEVYRLNMPAGTITAASFSASSTESSSFTEISVPVTNNWLHAGDNVVAVELHQASGTAADANMGLSLAAIFVTNSPSLAGVLINEVLANNATLEEPDGSKPDWVEIYNPSGNAVDLADLSLTDTTTDARRWVFPPGSIVPALGFLKVRLDPGLPPSATNTGFGLKANGGAVYLFHRPAEGGGVASAVSYGLQAADWSIGRVPDGSTNWVLTVPRFGLANVAAALGDPLQLKVNEWMAAPASGDDWFEVFNPNPQPVNLSKLWLSDDLAARQKYQIPALSFLGTGPEAFLRFWAANGAEADFTGFNLKATGEALAISTAAGTLINGVNFGPQQQDVSEGRLPDGAANTVSFPATPTPGKSNFLPLPNVVVNELLSHTDAPLEDAVEFWNPSGDDVDISGWYLSDSQNNLLKYRIPSNTVIHAGGYVVFYEYQFNYENPGVPFSFSSAKGDEVHLSQASAPGVLTGYRAFAEFGPSENGVSFGRFPTSVGADFTAMAERTFGVDNPATTNQFRTGTGKANSYAKIGPIVISEIMYHPAGTNDALEFVELHNILGTSQPLYDPDNTNNTWRLRKGIDFNFPLGVVVPPGGYLVIVSFDPQTDLAALTAFRAAYGSNMTLLGPYSGKLDNNGEAIELQKPDPPQTMGNDAGLVPYVLVERINYADTAPWPISPDGTGHSLKRIAPSLYGNDPFNWTGGPPTPGAADTSGAINTSPVLAPIGNRAVDENALLTFTATAIDADAPAQILTFSLDAGRPEGASITPAGVFTWVPTEGQGPGAYFVTIRVTDSGVPVLSDAETISITVREVNSAPVLNPIGNKIVNESTLVTFTATAVDTDDPVQTLTYSLDPGAPATAVINPSSGVFSWTPSVSDGPGVYPVTVRVRDNGSPPAEDFETLTITVNEVVVEAPRFVGLTVSEDRTVHLVWQTIVGKKYRVQHTADPASGPWLDLGADITATGPTAMATDAMGTNQQRFYRVRLVE